MSDNCNSCIHASQTIELEGCTKYLCTDGRLDVDCPSSCTRHYPRPPTSAGLLLNKCSYCTYSVYAGTCARATYPYSDFTVTPTYSKCSFFKEYSSLVERVLEAVETLYAIPLMTVSSVLTFTGPISKYAHVTEAVGSLNQLGCSLSESMLSYAMEKRYLDVVYHTYEENLLQNMQVTVSLAFNYLELLKKYPLISVSPISRPNAKYNF